jgi:hypothetical protein
MTPAHHERHADQVMEGATVADCIGACLNAIHWTDESIR